MSLTTVTKINKQLKLKLACHCFGKADTKIKARGLFQYMGFTFFTAKEDKYWYCYEFTSGYLSVKFGSSEKEVIRQTRHKIDIYCKNKVGLWFLIRSTILKSGFANHARYSNLLPKEIHIVTNRN